MDELDITADTARLLDTDTSKTQNMDERHDDYDDDPELEGLTLYEKKATLINRDLDSQGMGKYQWCVFFLCGFGYLLDLLWAQAFGIVVASIQQEFGFSDADLGNLSTAFSAGLTAGAFVWGFLVDIIGRYWAFNFTVLWASVFGLVLGVPDTYNSILVLTAFIGMGIGGNIPIDTTICLECLPQNRRWLLPALSVFQPIGVVMCSGIAYGLVPRYSCAENIKSCNLPDAGTPCCSKADNYGWRYLMFVLGAMTTCVFIARFFLFQFQESPKYLLYRGKDAKALKSLHYIARFNGYSSNVTLQILSRLRDDRPSRTPSISSDESGDPLVVEDGEPEPKELTTKQKFNRELARYKMLFKSPAMTRLTLLIWVIYAFDYWGFTIAGTLLPTILRNRGQELGLSLLDTYRSYIYIYTFGIPGVILGTTIYGWRRISMVTSSALFGICLFVFTTVHDQASYIGVNGLVYFFQSMFNGILYGITPEFYPAPIRGTACGVASFWGRVFSIIAPIAGSQVLNADKEGNGVLYMAGSGVFVATIAIFFIPKQFMGASSL